MRSGVIGKPMFARLHDQDRGFIRRLACNFCKFVGGKVGKIIAGVNAAVCSFANLFWSESAQVTKILRHSVHIFFVGDFHG